MLQLILGIFASVLSLYSVLCFIRIILTWIPSLSYSPFARFLSTICDPYLNLFRGIKWLVLGSFDFSPALSLCLLGAGTSILKSLSNGGRISIGVLLAMLIDIIWTIITSLLTFIIILLVIRLIIILTSKSEYANGNILIEQVDRSISALVFRVASFFTGGRRVTYKAALITSIIMLIITNFIGSILFSYISGLLIIIPF